MAGRKQSSFYTKKSIIGHAERYMFWEEFRRKHPMYKDMGNGELSKIVHRFFKFVGETLVDSEHGVVLNNIGYFGNASFNNKKVIKKGNNTIFNFRNKGAVYISYFFPRVFRGNPLDSWSFQITRGLALRMRDNINNGLEYMCHYDIIRNNSKKKVKYY